MKIKPQNDRETLGDCVAGDLVVVLWRDHGTHLDNTEQYVRVSSTPKRKTTTHRMVRLVDPETLCEYADGVAALGGNRHNVFSMRMDVRVLAVVEKSRHAHVDGEERARVVDADDPMTRRMSELKNQGEN